jgi:uncharacterized damage-inducible protein DinB
MSSQTLLASLLHYKADADAELLDAIVALGETSSPDYQEALRVLNHAHIVDRIFAAHLEKRAHTYAANWIDEAPLLTQLSPDIRDTDRWYVDYVSRLSPEALEETIDFAFTDGARGRMSREEMLAHVIAHAGYHRGEAGRLLPQVSARDVFAGYLHRAEPKRRE